MFPPSTGPCAEAESTRPHVDRTHFHSPQELRDHVLAQLGEALAAVQAKADPQELEDYKHFIAHLSERVAGRSAVTGFLARLEPRLLMVSAVRRFSPVPLPKRLLYGRRGSAARVALSRGD